MEYAVEIEVFVNAVDADDAAAQVKMALDREGVEFAFLNDPPVPS